MSEAAMQVEAGSMSRKSAHDTQGLRVVLVNCEGFLGDIIKRAVLDAPDLDIVATLAPDNPGVVNLSVDADLVLWNDAEETRLERLVASAAHKHAPRILATLRDGRDAALWELVPQRTSLGMLSPSSLVETIRGTAPHGAGETS
jgi:hypothetical protein